MKVIRKIPVSDFLQTFVRAEDMHDFLILSLENEIAGAKEEIEYYQNYIETLEPGYKYQKPEYRVKIRAYKKSIEINTQALKLLKQYIKLADKASSVLP
jgi:hypothetical protein